MKKTVLPNDMRVLSDHVAGLRSVSVGVLVNVGPRHENPQENGYSHLVEHMLFQGTGTRDAQAIAEMMEISGGAIGAFTARDYTVYHATVLDDYLPYALEALGDMLTNSQIPAEALDRQRGVILNEINGREDPLRRVNDLAKQSIWPDSPLSQPITGSHEAIETVSRSDLMSFMQNHYVANRMIVAAAGSVKHDDLTGQVMDAFHNVDPKPTTKQAVNVPTPKQGAVLAEPRDSKQVYFAVIWPAPSYTSEDRYGWHVFASLLGGSATSRLYSQLREKRGLVYNINASYRAYADTGALVIEGATAPQTLQAVLSSIFLEVFNMATDEPDIEAHFRAVRSLVSQHLLSGDRAYVRMSRLAMQEQYFGRLIDSDEITAGLKSQSPELTQTIASELINGGLPCIGLTGPLTDSLLEAVGSMLTDFGGPSDVGWAHPPARANRAS